MLGQDVILFILILTRYNLVSSGAVAPEGFLPPQDASDFFEDLNVLAIVVEVPNSMLGTAPTHVAVAQGYLPVGSDTRCLQYLGNYKQKTIII